MAFYTPTSPKTFPSHAHLKAIGLFKKYMRKEWLLYVGSWMSECQCICKQLMSCTSKGCKSFPMSFSLSLPEPMRFLLLLQDFNSCRCYFWNGPDGDGQCLKEFVPCLHFHGPHHLLHGAQLWGSVDAKHCSAVKGGSCEKGVAHTLSELIW